MTDKDPRYALLKGLKVNAENIISNQESGYFEYSWSGNNAGKHFKKIRKRVRFQNKLENTPNSIDVYDLELSNCSNLVISNITNKGFTVQITGIRAAENLINFNWRTL